MYLISLKDILALTLKVICSITESFDEELYLLPESQPVVLCNRYMPGDRYGSGFIFCNTQFILATQQIESIVQISSRENLWNFLTWLVGIVLLMI